jgi:hypothetical protein
MSILDDGPIRRWLKERRYIPTQITFKPLTGRRLAEISFEETLKDFAYRRWGEANMPDDEKYHILRSIEELKDTPEGKDAISRIEIGQEIPPELIGAIERNFIQILKNRGIRIK